MDITFVNHSSIVVEAGPIRLLMDPWLEGTAFNEGWALLCESPFKHQDFDGITHIWFSHEHPDHFSPSDLQKVPENIRHNIEVLYRRTNDKRVISFCKKLGFKTTELELDQWKDLSDDFRIQCGAVGYDSWLAIESGNQTLLNVNDCHLQTEAQIEPLRRLGDIDLLCTQFSYAAWQGNVGDVEARQAEADHHIHVVENQIKVLKPKQVLPFASFVWFCHQENFYLNAEMNKVHRISERIEQQGIAKPLVMYPGDKTNLGAAEDNAHDNQSALDRYQADYQRAFNSQVSDQIATAEKTPNDLEVALKRFYEKHYQSNYWLKRAVLAFNSFKNRLSASRSLSQKIEAVIKMLGLSVETAHVYVSDWGQAYAITMSGTREIDLAKESCDIVMSADSFIYCLRFDWGGETLRVNGRYQEHPNAKAVIPWNTYPNRFFNYFQLPKMVSQGDELTFGFVASKVTGKFKRQLAA